MPAFALITIAIVLTAFVVWINVAIARRAKRIAVKWLESNGSHIESIEWNLFPGTVGISWRRYNAFEIRFIDISRISHHAFIAAPLFGSPWFLEDKTSAKPG